MAVDLLVNILWGFLSSAAAALSCYMQSYSSIIDLRIGWAQGDAHSSMSRIAPPVRDARVELR